MPEITVKTCSKCKIEKHPSDFNKLKSSTDGFQYSCRSCAKLYKNNNKEKIKKEAFLYRQENSSLIKKKRDEKMLCSAVEIKEKRNIYYQKNCDLIREKQKEFYKKNATREKQYQADYRKNNPEKVKSVNKKWRELNAEKVRIDKREYRKIRIDTDEFFALRIRIRDLISTSLKKNGYKKNSTSGKILGCAFEFFKIYIEGQFKDGMSWDNRSEWHLDHKIPISSAKTEDEILRLNHYTNFQPLWAADNIRKSDKMPPKNIQNKIALAYAKATGSELKQESLF